jgi:hypothetical protein
MASGEAGSAANAGEEREAAMIDARARKKP